MQFTVNFDKLLILANGSKNREAFYLANHAVSAAYAKKWLLLARLTKDVTLKKTRLFWARDDAQRARYWLELYLSTR